MLVCPACGEEHPERFRLCGFCGAPLASAPPPSVRKTVTAVFSDVTGSTALGERLDPEALRALMQRYFEEMRSVLERHGGTVEKFIGDAVVAVFGVPHVHEDDAVRAVRAAAEMRERVVALNEELERDWGASIEVRTGVNTGEVVAGDPASGQSFATGDTVNVAARLEESAEPGEVLLGEATYRLVRDAVEVAPVEPLTLKGKAHGVSAWRLLSVSPAAPGLARRLDSPLVGRTSELALLEQAFRRAVDERKPQLVTVLGEAGVGKSRLTEELVSLCGEHATVLRGHCLPYGEGITFWPVAEVLKQASGIDEGDSPEEARAKIGALLLHSDDAHLIAERAAGALGLSEGTGAIQETFWAVRKLLEALSGLTPLVVVFDDIHWAEASFLDLIEYLAGWTTEAPLLLLCLARPDLLETRPSWGGAQAQSTIVRLEPLDAGESETLVSNLLGRAQLAQEIADRITQAAEGNPLFVEEFLRMLVDDGVLRRENGRWLPTGELSEIAIPPSIAALLVARLDLLAPEERGVLERGSVVGQVFYWGAVADLTPAEARKEVGGSLQTLVRKELIRPEADGFAGEDAFRFHHILIRDAAYGGLAKLERAGLHERFAAWLEAKAGERLAEYEEIVGYHLEQAHRYRAELGPVDEAARAIGTRAAQSLASAGRRAFQRYDVGAATNLLERAARLLGERSPERLALLPQLVEVLIDKGELQEADRLIDEAVKLAREVDDPALGARARLLRLEREVQTGPASGGKTASAACEEAERELPLLKELGDEHTLARSWRLIGWWQFCAGRSAKVNSALEHALAHSTRSGDRRERAETLCLLAEPLWSGPTPVAEGIRRVEEILEEAKGELRVEASVVGVLGGFHAACGRFEEARRLYARKQAIYEELGMRLRAAAESQNVGVIELLADEPVAAEQALRAACEALAAMGEKGYFSTAAALLAEALYRQGRFDEAEDFTHVSEDAASPDDVVSQAFWRSTRAKVLARSGELESAELLARESVALFAETDWLAERGETLLDLAEVLRLAGRAREAVPVVEEALSLFERKGYVVAFNKARTVLTELAAE